METMSKQQWEAYCSVTRHIYEKPFSPDDTRVHDHCHLTGRYRDPAHSNYNLNYKNSFNIPIVFHNLSGYDAHFIIKKITTAYDGYVDVLPITKEKYISFTKHDTKDKNEKEFSEKNGVKLRFIDSFKFLNASLDKLASYLDKDKLKIVPNFASSARRISIFSYEKVSFRMSTLTASKNYRTLAYHRANYFSVR